jgi:hypothetical protein
MGCRAGPSQSSHELNVRLAQGAYGGSWLAAGFKPVVSEEMPQAISCSFRSCKLELRRGSVWTLDNVATVENHECIHHMFYGHTAGALIQWTTCRRTFDYDDGA